MKFADGKCSNEECRFDISIQTTSESAISKIQEVIKGSCPHCDGNIEWRNSGEF